jgi:hypothetical protein
LFVFFNVVNIHHTHCICTHAITLYTLLENAYLGCMSAA